MKKRSLYSIALLTLIIFLANGLFSQFAPTGAVWQYSEVSQMNVRSCVYVESVGDTIIQAKSCKKLESVSGPVGCSYNQVQFVYNEDSVVYFQQQGSDDFQVLYDLRADTDSSWMVNAYNNLIDQTDTFEVYVDSVDLVEINEEKLKKMYVTYKKVENEVNVGSYRSVIIERIGDIESMFNFRDPMLACEAGLEGLSVYKDSELGCYVTGKTDHCMINSCITSVYDKGAYVDMTVFPNPAKNQLNVIFSEFNCAEKYEVVVVDGGGNIIKTIVAESNSEVIDISGLSSGQYFLKVMSEEEVIFSGKFLKD